MDRSTALRIHICPSLPRSRAPAHCWPPRAADRQSLSIRLLHNQQAEKWEGLWPSTVLGRASPHPRILPPLRDSREEKSLPRLPWAGLLAKRMASKRGYINPAPVRPPSPMTLLGQAGRGRSRVYHRPVLFLFPVSCFLLPVSPSCDLNSSFALNVPRPLLR